MKLYPLKFNPIFKEKIWGGNKIKEVLKKDIGSLPNCGESWELSGVPGEVSIVSNGHYAGRSLNEIIKERGDDLLGESVHSVFGDEFPLLIKFIDAADDLSIQVHPDDKLAKMRHNSFGKTEMWYIMQADAGSSLITGFNRNLNRTEFLDFFHAGKLTDVLNRETVKEGDVFFLPAGRIHTIGKGLLIAEIQQTSDVTYRIYDFDRTDDNGNKRELHIEESLDALDYTFHKEYKTKYSKKLDERNQVVECPYFTTNVLILEKHTTLTNQLDSFRIYICTKGYGSISNVGIKAGEVVLMPASLGTFDVEVQSTMTLLEVYIS